MQEVNCKKRVLSLFSGCGGMDLGFEGGFEVALQSVNEKIHPDWIESLNKDKVLLSETSFETVFANDILQYAMAAWVPFFKKRGTPTSVFKNSSIVELVKSHQLGETVFPENIDIVTGGFPCQDFSVAGKRKGFNSHKSHLDVIDCDVSDPTTENRGMLYMWMKEVIEIVKPKVFIAENVKGLISIGEVRSIIENDFRSIDKDGYIVLPSQVINAANHGVPQSRERIFFIGFNKKYLNKKALIELQKEVVDFKYNPYPIKTHYLLNDKDPDSILKKFVTSEDVLLGLAEPEKSKDLSQQAFSKAKFLIKGQGNKEVNLKGLAPTIRSEHHGNIEFRRLSLENGGKNRDELKKGLLQRRLTVRECARLQTFPDNYEFVKKGTDYPLSASGAYKVIGNAVPPLLGYAIAKQLETIWDNVF